MKDKFQPEIPAYEYNLFIKLKYEEIQKKWFTNFRLETIQEFTNFKYEIVVNEKVKKNSLHYKLVGLRAPQILIPGGGPAISEWEYPILSGKYLIEFTNIDKKKNNFEINFSKKKIEVIKKPRQKYINIIIK